MSGHSHGHPQSPEDDARIAHEALAQGDLVHAVHHIGCALSARPLHPEWLGMLDSIPENLCYYFDYGRFARDLFMCDMLSVRSGHGTVYVFDRN